MGKPLVTALIDTYNHERFIAEAIESVLAQDYPASAMEILVVDDGSTDRTPEIIRSYGERVRYIRKENGGQASALNLGFAEARGEIIAMLDGDDVWLPSKISRVVAEFEKEPDALLVCHPYVTWVQEQCLEIVDSGFHPIRGKMPLTQLDLLRYGDYGTCGMALRRQPAGVLFPIPAALQIYADSYLVFLAIFAGKVVGLKECLTKYRHHESNLASFRQQDGSKARRRWECYARAIEEGKKWLVRNGEDLTRPDVAAYIKRHELVGQMLRFFWDPPKRLEYYRYLRSFHELYRPLWTQRYRSYHSLLALVALAVGYEAFTNLRQRYRDSSLSVKVRQDLFPVQVREAA